MPARLPRLMAFDVLGHDPLVDSTGRHTDRITSTTRAEVAPGVSTAAIPASANALRSEVGTMPPTTTGMSEPRSRYVSRPSRWCLFNAARRVVRSCTPSSAATPSRSRSDRRCCPSAFGEVKPKELRRRRAARTDCTEMLSDSATCLTLAASCSSRCHTRHEVTPSPAGSHTE
jgi:hypothetical protein